MRQVIVHRERALACFAVVYHCVIGQDQAAHLKWAKEQDRHGLMLGHGAESMRNGETIRLPVAETENSLFVIAYLEDRELYTQVLAIPAGSEDCYFTVTTEYDGNRHLALRLRAETA